MFVPRDVTVVLSSGRRWDPLLELAASIAATAGAALRVVAQRGAPWERAASWVERAPPSLRARAARGVGEAAGAVLDEILRDPCDLIVKTGPSAPPGFWDVRLLDRRLLHETSCAVLLLRPECQRIRRVAAAVRPPGALEEAEAPWRARRVLDGADLLSRACQAELHVLHGWTPGARDALAFAGPSREVAPLRRARRDEVRARLGAWLCRARMPVHPRRQHALLGAAEEVLVTGPPLLRVDVLAVGGPRRPDRLASRLLSTADYLLRAGRCSVLVTPGRRSALRAEGGAPSGARGARVLDGLA